MKQKQKRLLSRNTPRKTAKLFRDQMRPNIICQQDEWLDWNEHCYIRVEEATLDSEISEWLDESYEKTIDRENGKPRETAFNPKPADVWRVRDSLKKLVHKRADTMSPPCWLDGRNLPKPWNIISVENGLLDMETGERIDATPLFFNRVSLPIVYDPNAPEPELWLKFLWEVMGGTDDATEEQAAKTAALVALVQEMFGYLISTDQSKQAVFFLWGVPRSGKGTILRILTDLVGKLNCYYPSLTFLPTQFGLWGSMGKSVIQITDMDTDDRKALAAAVTVINKISGEDDVTIDRKSIEPWTGRLPGRCIMAGNRLPNFGSGTIALATRLKIIPFKVSFVGREDRELTNKIRTELPGILNWALLGLARLRERGDFEEPEASRDAKTRVLYQSDPVRGFVDDRCEIDADAFVDKDVFYGRYRRFCGEVGTHPAPLHVLTERLSEIYPTVYASKRSAGDGSRPPIFKGLRFNDTELMKVYKVDEGLEGLGATGADALQHDEHGEPILRMECDQ